MQEMKSTEDTTKYLQQGVLLTKFAYSAHGVYKIAKLVSPGQALKEGAKLVAMPVANYVSDKTGYPIVSTLTYYGLEGIAIFGDPVGYVISKGVQYGVEQVTSLATDLVIESRAADFVIEKAHLNKNMAKAIVKIGIEEAGNMGARELTTAINSSERVKKTKAKVNKVKSDLVKKTKTAVQSKLSNMQGQILTVSKTDSQPSTTLTENDTPTQAKEVIPPESAFRDENFVKNIVNEEGKKQQVTTAKEMYAAKAENGYITKNDVIVDGRLTSSMPSTVVYAEVTKEIEQTGDKTSTAFIQEKYKVKEGVVTTITKAKTIRDGKENEAITKVKKSDDTKIEKVINKSEHQTQIIKKIKTNETITLSMTIIDSEGRISHVESVSSREKKIISSTPLINNSIFYPKGKWTSPTETSIVLDALIDVIDHAIITYCECEIAKLKAEKEKQPLLEEDKRMEVIFEQEKKLMELKLAIEKQNRAKKIEEIQDRIEDLKKDRKRIKAEKKKFKYTESDKASDVEDSQVKSQSAFFESHEKKINYLARKIIDLVAIKELVQDEQLAILHDYVTVILDEKKAIILSTIGREQRELFCQKIADELALSLRKIIAYENDSRLHSQKKNIKTS